MGFLNSDLGSGHITKALFVRLGNAVLGQRGDWGAVHVSLWAASTCSNHRSEGRRSRGSRGARGELEEKSGGN